MGGRYHQKYYTCEMNGYSGIASGPACPAQHD
jgi:hypothetical protein